MWKVQFTVQTHVHTQHLFFGLFVAILFGKCNITSSPPLKKSKWWLWRADHSGSGNEAGLFMLPLHFSLMDTICFDRETGLITGQ